MARNDESSRFSAIFRKFEEQPRAVETVDRVRPVNRLRMKYSNAPTTPQPIDHDHEDTPPLSPPPPPPPAPASPPPERCSSSFTGPPLRPRKRNSSPTKDCSRLSDTITIERNVETRGKDPDYSDPDHGAQPGNGSESDGRRKSSGSDHCEGFSEGKSNAVGSQDEAEWQTGNDLAGTSPTDRPTESIYANDGDAYDQTEDNDVSLSSYVWFFDEVDREKSERLLAPMIKLNGSYLVRKSERGGDASQHSLSVVFGGRVYHLRLRQRQDGKFAIGKEKDDEKMFETLPQLISFYQNNSVELIGDPKKKTASGKVQLKHCPTK